MCPYPPPSTHRSAVGIAPIVVVVGGSRVQPYRGTEVLNGAAVVAEPLARDAAVVVGEAVARLQLDGTSVVGNGSSMVAQLGRGGREGEKRGRGGFRDLPAGSEGREGGERRGGRDLPAGEG